MVKLISGVMTGKRGSAPSPSTAGELDASGAGGFLNPVSFAGLEELPADFCGLLGWHVRYAPALHGRRRESGRLREWARNGKELDVMVLAGAGGSGRKRLAAELALELHGKDGWLSGFLSPEAKLPPRKRPRSLKQSLLIIVDRAEEMPDRVAALLDRLEGWSMRASARIRVLLLAREAGVERLDGILRSIGGKSTSGAMVLHALAAGDAGGIARDVIAGLGGRGAFGRVPENALREGLGRWLSEDPELHGLPLSVIAATVHALLDAENAFSLPLREVLMDLAGREMAIVRDVSLAGGLGAHGLARLLGLSTLKGGLDALDIGRLSAERGLCDGDRPLTSERLSGTPWWNGKRLGELLPERAGAAFIVRSLLNEETEERLPGWIAAALKGAESGFAARLPRLAHDIYAVNSAAGRRFVEILAKTVRGRPDLAEACSAFVLGGEVGPMTAAFAVAVAEELLGSGRRDLDRQALLVGLSDALALLGRHGAALEAAEEAVASGNGKPAGPSARVRALQTLSARLAGLGRHGAALDAAEEAVKAARSLSMRDAAAGAPLLVQALEGLSARLAGLGRHGAALDAAEEAVKTARSLSMRDAAAGAPLLVQALEGLSARLVTLGRHGAALDAAEEAVKVARGMPAPQAIARMHLLARAWSNLSDRLKELGRLGPAVEAAEAAAEAFRLLAMRDRLTYLPELARSLSSLSSLRSALGRHKGALEAMEEAVARQRELVGRNRALHLPRLADTLVARSALLLKLGRHGRAMEAAVEAVEYRRRMADQNPAVHKAGLADALVALAGAQAAGGHKKEAAATVTEALGVLSEPFLKRPDTYVKSMARVLESYLEHHEAAGLEPDMKLVEPVLEKIDELQKK